MLEGKMGYSGSIDSLKSLGFKVIRKYNDMTVMNKLLNVAPWNLTVMVIPRSETYSDIYVDMFQLAVNHNPEFKVDDQLDRDTLGKMINSILHNKME
jgi:hypothetical protein